MSINLQQSFGVFIIPIRFNKKYSVYGKYLDFVASLEDDGYEYAFIGEHLTDPCEDIQSSIIFASALLAKTKKLKVALSVLPLTYYNIPVLIKQLEDVYLLSNNRLMIGFSPGALDSDMNYIGLNPADRYSIFCEKLREFFHYVDKSNVLNKLPKSSFFSTLLSPYPLNSYKLFEKGYSALSSNFTNISHHPLHWQCLNSKNLDSNKSSLWHVAFNIVPCFESLSAESQSVIVQSLKYIFDKLNMNAIKIMFPNNVRIDPDILPEDFASLLIHHQIHNIDLIRSIVSNHSDIVITNLFDCLSDPEYCDQVRAIPSLWLTHSNS